MNHDSAFWDRVAAEYHQSGLSLADVSRELGIEYGEARAALQRRRVDLTRETLKTIRQRVQKITSDEGPEGALEYVLDVFEQISWVHHIEVHPTDIVKVIGNKKTILRLLHDNIGKPLSHDSIYTAITAHVRDADSLPEPKIVKVYVSLLRKKLIGTPWRIKTIWGHGYQMDEVSQ